jgi:hypothetical protein
MIPSQIPSATSSKQFAILPLATLAAFGECSRTEILTYSALAAHADSYGYCWPGRERLASLTGLDPCRISKATRGLVDKGLIRKDYTPHSHVAYTLLLGYPRPETGGVPKLTPRTDQPNSKEKEPHCRPAAPLPPSAALIFEAARPDPTPPPQAPEPPIADLAVLKTPPPDCIPESWIELARQLRPDLSVDLIRASADKFLDYHRAKGTVRKSWVYEWKPWIRNERAPRTPKPPARDSRYSHTATPLTPEQKAAMDAKLAAVEAHNQKQHEARLEGYHRATGKQDKQEPATPVQRPIDRVVEETERERQRRIEIERQRVMTIWEAKMRERGGAE